MSTHPITGIDHCIILVNELEAARTQIERLGFVCGPRGIHSDHMGTHNHCVMLARGYFEVLSIRLPTEQNAAWRAKLREAEGLAGIALEAIDARTAYDNFNAAGIDASPPVDFARAVQAEQGVGEANFTITKLPTEATPGTNMFVCQHHTPEWVWLPELLTQPNGATSLQGLTVQVEQPEQLIGAYSKVFGSARLTADNKGLRVDTERGHLEFITAERATHRFDAAVQAERSAPYIAAITLGANLAQARQHLTTSGIRYVETTCGHLQVPPESGCGAIFEFIAQPD